MIDVVITLARELLREHFAAAAIATYAIVGLVSFAIGYVQSTAAIRRSLARLGSRVEL